MGRVKPAAAPGVVLDGVLTLLEALQHNEPEAVMNACATRLAGL